MKLRSAWLIIIIILLSLPLSGALCKKKNNLTDEPLTLKVWLINEDSQRFKDVYEDYHSNHSNVTIEFIEKDYSDRYQNELVDEIAANSAPDIAMIREDWVTKHADKLVPMPGDEEKSQEDYTKEMRDVFVTAVSEKMIIDNKIYAVPLKMDTLVLYYNTEDFRNARINEPPKNWEEFIVDVKKLTQKNQFGAITHSAVALGASNNVNQSQDILYSLMIQNGTKMISDDHKSATFNTSATKASGEVYYPGTKALEFYNSFANPSKETYTWNSSMDNSLTAFTQGKVSMIFDYEYRKDEIYNLAPTLDIEIAPFPQIKDTSSPSVYPSFWGLSVTNNSAHSDVAWDFIRYISSRYDQTKKESVKRDYERMRRGTEVFLGQPYIARTFYKTKEPEQVDEIIKRAIQNHYTGQASQAALDAASSEVTSILQSKG